MHRISMVSLALLDDFEQAVREYEMKGATAPEYWPEIIRTYEVTKLNLMNRISELEARHATN